MDRERDGSAQGRRNHGAKLAGFAWAGLLVLTSACSWVDVDPEAQAVGVVKTLGEVSDCRKIGEIRAKTTAKVSFIARNETKVAVELERLARNDAAASGGNTIVPLGPVTAEGGRHFGNYVCPR